MTQSWNDHWYLRCYMHRYFNQLSSFHPVRSLKDFQKSVYDCYRSDVQDAIEPGLGESESKLGLESTRVTFFERLGLDSDSRFWRLWLACMTRVIHWKKFSFVFIKTSQFIRLNFQLSIKNWIYCIGTIFPEAFFYLYIHI
jgi:hypothetical protein